LQRVSVSPTEHEVPAFVIHTHFPLLMSFPDHGIGVESGYLRLLKPQNRRIIIFPVVKRVRQQSCVSRYAKIIVSLEGQSTCAADQQDGHERSQPASLPIDPCGKAAADDVKK